MRKAIVVVVLVALVLLLAVPATANAGSSRDQFPKGAKIAVTVGAPDAEGYCPVHFAWPDFPKTAMYGVNAYAKRVRWETLYIPISNSCDMTLPPGNWTVVVDAYDYNPGTPWTPGQVLDSLKATFSVP